MSRRKILILVAHPAVEKSRVNRVLIRAARDLPGVTIQDLYEAYPDFHIDVGREQGLLLQHDLYVFHHPFFWYSTPAILKEWQDVVLEHGWAYGRRGNALHGKLMLNAITTGGREEAYDAEGYHRFSIRQLLAPLEQTAYLCGMEYLPPFVAYGTHAMTPEEAASHASDYRRLLTALRDDRVDLDRARGLPRINLNLDDIIVGPEGA